MARHEGTLTVVSYAYTLVLWAHIRLVLACVVHIAVAVNFGLSVPLVL